MASNALEKFKETLPDIYKPETNTVILALLMSLAESDQNLETQVANAKEQLFVRSAAGVGLDRIALSQGVSRPPTLGLIDSSFQELIPNLSLKPKQIKKAFYDTADVFWGELFSRANTATANFFNLSSLNFFNLNLGDELIISVNNGPQQTIKIEAGDVAAPGQATAQEVKIWLEQIKGISIQILVDLATDNETVNIRTNAPGTVGSLEFFPSSAIASGKLELVVGIVDILDLDQRFVVYNVNPNELLIEIPVTVPTLKDTLRGSHHFHATAIIEPPQPPNNGVWEGSFLFNPSGSSGTFAVTSQSASLTSAISVGDVLTTVTVDDTSAFVNPVGDLIFDFGREGSEFSIPYTGILNANTIAIDPNYVFSKSHLIGGRVNALSARLPYVPRVTGNDLAIYLPSPSNSRIVVQNILEKLKAAGILLKFVVLIPKYKYLIDNPFLTTDDAPSC